MPSPALLGRAPRAILAALAIALGAGACGKHEPVGAVGPNDEISLVTNTPREGSVVREVRRIFSYPVDVVRPERAFRVDLVPFRRFNVHRYVKNQVIAVDLSRGDDLAGALPGMLGPLGEQRLAGREPFLLMVPDAWATGQTTLFAVAWSEADLAGSLARCDSVGLRREYETSVVDGLSRTMFGLGEEKALAAQIARQYGWSLRLTPRFSAAENRERRVVKLSADNPVRLILVHWAEGPVALTPEVWNPVLTDLLWAVNDGDFFMPERTQIFPADFQGRPALKWEGIWQNEKHVIGGPFRAFATNRGDRAFLLVGIVFNPGQDKVFALRQVEAMMVTFSVVE